MHTAGNLIYLCDIVCDELLTGVQALHSGADVPQPPPRYTGPSPDSKNTIIFILPAPLEQSWRHFVLRLSIDPSVLASLGTHFRRHFG